MIKINNTKSMSRQRVHIRFNNHAKNLISVQVFSSTKLNMLDNIIETMEGRSNRAQFETMVTLISVGKSFFFTQVM